MIELRLDFPLFLCFKSHYALHELIRPHLLKPQLLLALYQLLRQLLSQCLVLADFSLKLSTILLTADSACRQCILTGEYMITHSDVLVRVLEVVQLILLVGDLCFLVLNLLGARNEFVPR